MKNQELAKNIDSKEILAAFDVDGTLTYTDSFMLFLRHISSRSGFILGLLRTIPYLIAYKMGQIGRDDAKNALLTHFLKNMSVEEFELKARDFAKIYSKILRDDAKEIVRQHIKQGHKVILVSASLKEYLQYLATELGAQNTLATEVEIIDGKLSGKMAGHNCRAQIKLDKIRETYPNDIIFAAYGDSRGDKEMLEAAENPFFCQLHGAPKNKLWEIIKLYC